MTETSTATRVAARTVDAVKTYGEGDAAVHALAGVTVDFPAHDSISVGTKIRSFKR